jgi:hypothetical protein
MPHDILSAKELGLLLTRTTLRSKRFDRATALARPCGRTDIIHGFKANSNILSSRALTSNASGGKPLLT